MKMLVYILPFFIINVSYSFSPNTCHSGLLNIKGYLGMKTPYRFVSSSNYSAFQFDGCSPDKIIGFIRHGTSLPGLDNTLKMEHQLPQLKENIVKALSGNSATGLLCEEDIEALSSWELRVENPAGDKWLAHEGENEMVGLAGRLLRGFPKLLSRDYSNSTYYFKYTATQRAEQSAIHFTSGLFGRNKSTSVQYPESLDKDPILRFYTLCDKWIKMIRNDSREFTNSIGGTLRNEMTKTCEDVSKRLGFNLSLPYDDIYLMYSICASETAWNREKRSPWCSVFSESDFEVIQYVNDLLHYWRDGYGHELTYRIACPAIADAFKFIGSDKSRNATAVFYFTHSGTILKLLSHLGLYKDPFPLTTDLSRDLRETRKWRTASIDAFASNIIFVSYKCGEEKKVLTLHQERPVQIPGCPQDHLCPLTLLLNKFNESINNCNFDEMCSLSK